MRTSTLVLQVEGTISQIMYTLQRLAQDNPNKTIKQLWVELHRN